MGKPIKGTNYADLNLIGTINSDTIQGKDGNDTITGGGGNDNIDGGNGIDTAVFSGFINDYLLSFKNTGNDKVTVTDMVGGDGTDQLKHVEFLQFQDATVNVANGAAWSYGVNMDPDPSAEDPAHVGTLYAGSGIPAENFGTARNEDAGVELGLQVIYRQGPSVTSADNYADGVLHFSVNDGPQSTTNGSSIDRPDRAAWSFDYSIVTGLNGETTNLGDFTFKLLYDGDPGVGTSYRTLTLEAEPALPPQPAGESGYQWRDEGTGLVFISDDEGTGSVTQNSENYAFGFFQAFLTSLYGPGNSFDGPAYFDIVLQAFDTSNELIAQNHISVDVNL
jgi:RTX calcium-binding nonapeptide repeat (4 copies)